MATIRQAPSNPPLMQADISSENSSMRATPEGSKSFSAINISRVPSQRSRCQGRSLKSIVMSAAPCAPASGGTPLHSITIRHQVVLPSVFGLTVHYWDTDIRHLRQRVNARAIGSPQQCNPFPCDPDRAWLVVLRSEDDGCGGEISSRLSARQPSLCYTNAHGIRWRINRACDSRLRRSAGR
jgi:hypothetical protein